jgi:hypothetical protein
MFDDGESAGGQYRCQRDVLDEWPMRARNVDGPELQLAKRLDL